MRIAFATTEYVTEPCFDGGLANYLHRVSLSLIKFGHTPVIIVSSDKNERFFHNGIEVYRVKIRKVNKLVRYLSVGTISHQAWLSKIINKAVKAIHKNNPFDIIQYPSYEALGLYRIPEIPSIVRVSSYAPVWRLACGEKNPTGKQQLVEKLEIDSFRNADALFGPSKVIANLISKDIKKEIKVIETPFILDTIELDKKIYEKHLSNKRFLLFFGRLNLHKGVITIGDMIHSLLEQHADLHFVFVGKNMPYQNTTAIDYIMDKAGEYKGRVIYFDKLPHSQLYPIIKGSEIVVLPSRIDNFPNTCLEAMAHKRIVIGTDGASFEQLIENGVNGFLCKKDDSENLLDIINLVLGLTEGEKNKIEEKSYQRIQELRPEITVNKLVEFYNQVIAGKES